MPQFSVHRNQHAPTKARFPLLLDIQTNFLEELATRVVIPLTPQTASKSQKMNRLTPVVVVDGKQYIAVTPQLSAIAKKELGPVVADLAADRADFISALDFLLTGI
jgi:toxin CcdB